MNLSQAYLGWQQQSQNRDLYISTREAFRKAWFTLPTNKPCSYYTKEILGEALAATREIESNKTKAASVMIHVLTFANFAEPKFNPKPDFTYHDLMEYTKGPLADPDIVKPQEKPSCLDDLDDTDLDIDPVTALPRKKMEQESVDSIRLREKMHNTEFEIRRGGFEPEDMEPKEKKPRGREPKPVAQIDPKTLNVVKVWSSRSDAERQLGAHNIDRCVKMLRKSAESYWCDADQVDDFKERLKAKTKAAAEKTLARVKAKTKVAKKPKTKTAKLESKNTKSLVDKFAEEQQAFEQLKREGKLPVVSSSPTEDLQPHNAAADALKVFTDDELLAELDRRGWVGELRRVQIITIGKE